MVRHGFLPISPKGLDEVLLDLSKLPNTSFSILLTEVRGPEGFNRDSTRCSHLAQAIDLSSAADAFLLLSASEFFYTSVNKIKDTDEEIPDIIDDALGQFEELEEHPEEIDRIKERLLALVQSNPAVERQEKLERLQSGLLPNGVGFTSFVDLRPDFADDRSEINRIIPVILFRVSTDSDEASKSSYVFQLTEEALGKLKTAVEDAERKVQAVRLQKGLADMIVKKPAGGS